MILCVVLSTWKDIIMSYFMIYGYITSTRYFYYKFNFICSNSLSNKVTIKTGLLRCVQSVFAYTCQLIKLNFCICQEIYLCPFL